MPASSASPLAGDKIWMEFGVVPFLQGAAAVAFPAFAEALRQPASCFAGDGDDSAVRDYRLARRFLFLASAAEGPAVAEDGEALRAVVGLCRSLGPPSGPAAHEEGLQGPAALAARLLQEAIRLAPKELLAYQELCLLLQGHGADPLPVARAAVEQGLWVDALQRPTVYFPELESRAFWDPEQLDARARSWLRELEARHGVVLEELGAALGARGACFSEVGGAHRAGGRHDGDVLGRGNWSEVVLYGLHEEETCVAQAAFPRTRELLRSLVPEAVAMAEAGFGEVIVSRLAPNSHIQPHCAPNNTRLTAHLGLRVPEGCRIRVGKEWRTWQEGKILLFDDSFEHEVVTGDTERIVLLIRFWHPQCEGREKEYMKRDDRSFNWNGFQKGMPPVADEEVERALFEFDMNDTGICPRCGRDVTELCMPCSYLDKTTYRMRVRYRCTQ